MTKKNHQLHWLEKFEVMSVVVEGVLDIYNVVFVDRSTFIVLEFSCARCASGNCQIQTSARNKLPW